MEKRVLVLNLDHYPIAVVPVQKAMVLLLMEKAQQLSTYELLEIRTVSRSYSYPAVIRLAQYKHIPYKGSAPAQQDMIGGRVPLLFDVLFSSMPFVKDNRMKVY